MEIIPIITPVTPALAATAKTAVVALQTIVVPIKIILSPQQSALMIDVSTVREAEITAINAEVMVAHPETVPETTTLAAIAALTQEENDTENLLAQVNEIETILGDHLKIVKNNRLTYASQGLSNAKHIGKTNAPLQAVSDSISARFFSRSSSKTETTYNIAIRGNIILKGVKTGKYLTNQNKSILSILNVGGNLASTLKVNPGNGVLIPNTWTNIVVTNLSDTEEGIFTVFMN